MPSDYALLKQPRISIVQPTVVCASMAAVLNESFSNGNDIFSVALDSLSYCENEKTVAKSTFGRQTRNVTDLEGHYSGSIQDLIAQSMATPEINTGTLLQTLEALLEASGSSPRHAAELVRWLDCGIELLAAGGTLPDVKTPRGIDLTKHAPKDGGLAELPLNLSLPAEKYSGSPEAKRGGGGIVAFLERVWLPVLDAGRRDGKIYIDRRRIDQIDSSILEAISNYQRKEPDGKIKRIPEKLLFPTLKQVNDATLVAHRDVARLAVNRAKNGATIP